MKRGKRKALLSAQGDSSTGGHDVQDGFKRAGIRELVKNEHVIELAELPNTPDRRSIKRVFERTPLREG